MGEEILTIKITKDETKKRYYSQMSIKNYNFDKKEILDLIEHQFSKFKIKKN